MTDFCEHFHPTDRLTATGNGCAECLAMGSSWTELRICLECGHVGCCEDSKHAHAFQHFNATGHATIASFEPGQTWAWCYVHRKYYDPMPPGVPKRRSPLSAWIARLRRR